MSSSPKILFLAAALLLFERCQLRPDTPLTSAAGRGDVAETRAILDRGAPVDETGGHGLTALIAAARGGHIDTVRLLLARGASPDREAGVNNWTPLMHAIHKAQIGSVRALLEGGATANARSGSGLTALIMAAGYGYTGIVQTLLDAGADPYAEMSDGTNALTVAVSGVMDIDRFTAGECQAGTVTALLKRAPHLKLKHSALVRLAALSARVGGCSTVVALLQSH